VADIVVENIIEAYRASATATRETVSKLKEALHKFIIYEQAIDIIHQQSMEEWEQQLSNLKANTTSLTKEFAQEVTNLLQRVVTLATSGLSTVSSALDNLATDINGQFDVPYYSHHLTLSGTHTQVLDTHAQVLDTKVELAALTEAFIQYAQILQYNHTTAITNASEKASELHHALSSAMRQFPGLEDAMKSLSQSVSQMKNFSAGIIHSQTELSTMIDQNTAKLERHAQVVERISAGPFNLTYLLSILIIPSLIYSIIPGRSIVIPFTISFVIILFDLLRMAVSSPGQVIKSFLNLPSIFNWNIFVEMAQILVILAGISIFIILIWLSFTNLGTNWLRHFNLRRRRVAREMEAVGPFPADLVEH
jgi:hypothetical protein